jgi:flavin reductase (DIM6/NTAB) family NADH-FMN oxidoreductase RutF
MPIDEAGFREVLSHFPSGVTVVTTADGEELSGMTVASFASLSLHPPLVLICIEKSVKTHDAIARAGRFGVSILAAHQANVSNRFASKAEDKFEGIPFRRGPEGSPLIEGAIATMECTVMAQLPGGDHSIFVGEVFDTTTAAGHPLVYFRSGYHKLA